jgi:hypothetical protein
VRLQDCGCASGVRERAHPAADAARQHQLRAARRGLAGRRLGVGLREVRDGCRPACHDAGAGQGRRPQREGQALDAIREVGPGSHFLGCAHTQANFETAFYRSTIADNNSFEQWEAEGRQDAAQRANKLYKRMLSEYEAPALDPAIDEALLAFMAEKKSAVPDSNI